MTEAYRLIVILSIKPCILLPLFKKKDNSVYIDSKDLFSLTLNIQDLRTSCQRKSTAVNSIFITRLVISQPSLENHGLYINN